MDTAQQLIEAQTNIIEAKDKIIGQQQEQIALLEELAEQRRIAFHHQSKELAELRQYHHVNKCRWGFFWWLLLHNVWPFTLWYRKFER